MGLLLSVRHESHAAYLLVEVKMEYLDTRHAPKLREEVNELLRTEKSQTIVLDLGHVQFIDSSGFGALMNILSVCKKEGKRLVLIHMTTHAESCFRMLNLDKLFEIAPNFELIDPKLT